MNISGKKKNLQVQFTDLQEDMKVPSGGSYKVDIQVPKGVLAGCLYDHDAAECLPQYDYEIYDEEGKKLFEGKTDESGFFRHKDVPEDYYILRANGEDHALVTIDEDEEPQTIAVLNEKGDTDTSDDDDDDADNQSDNQDEQSDDEDADSSDDDDDEENNQSDNQDEQSDDEDADTSDDDDDDDEENNQSDNQDEQNDDEDADSADDDDEAGNVSDN